MSGRIVGAWLVPIVLVASACVEPVVDPGPMVASREDPPRAKPIGDPLLARARAEMSDGRLPEDVRAQILASDDSAHARARRILAVMDRQARGEAEPEREDPAVAPPTEVIPPPMEPEGGTVTGAEIGAETDGAESPSQPRLTVLTRISLTRTGKTATLTVHAASSLEVGLAQQSGIARLVVESAGALPTVLQARPSIDGLRISDVRRGQDTVQIAIDVGDDWTVGRPTGFSGGARLKFTRR